MKLRNKLVALSLIASSITFSQTLNPFYESVVANVSASNILTDLTTFENFGEKRVSSQALTNTENWIYNRYQTLGYTNIELQEFTFSSGTSNNIIVTKTGTTYPDTYIIIDAHYDTINGPGTNDNGSGTIMLMEIARLLANVDTQYSIKFIHFSGEEEGLHGSNHYVNNTVSPQNLDIRLVFNIDQVGGVAGETNDTIVCEEDRSNPPANNSDSSVMTNILATCIELYSNLNTTISYAYASDYVPFENNGEIITGLYEANETPHAHRATDLLENMDPTFLTEVTKGSVGALLEFAISSAHNLSVQDNTFDTIKLYPNPTNNGLINLSFAKALTEQSSITIYNVLGKIVLKKTGLIQQEILNLKNLPKGIYLASIETGDSKTTKKIILN